LDDAFYSDGGANQSEVIWYVNDDVFKRGIYGTPRPDGVAPVHEIWPGDTGLTQDVALKIANTVSVQVIPKSGDQVGDVITSPTVVVENALPVLGNVGYAKSSHPENINLVLTWEFWDFEINQGADIDETAQFDIGMRHSMMILI